MAWAFLGVSNVVEVTATPHALVTTGIAGTLQAGDLLVACISSRIASTTSVTLPVGWTLVSEQKNNNVLSTGSAAPSGLMAYCVRGASNPALTFTHPVAPSVAIGRIVAYRDVSASAPKDTQTSFTTAISITAVSGTGLTTTQADDLIVAMAAGGQEAAWSSFNATSPAGASGATSTAAPTTTWLERADSLTTTGVDTSLAIFDAIKTAAGATGNLTATASVAAAHVVVAGAFKIGPVSISDAWNINNKSAGVTLTNNDRTATTTTLSGVRSTTTYASGTAGKYYAELVFDTVVSPDPQLGINRTANPDITTTTETVRVLPATGNIVLGGATTLGSVGACVSGDVICLAWDAGAERIWFRKNNGLWNNDAAADPSAGTNGFDVSVLENSAFALWMRNGNAGAVRGATVRAKNADFTYSGPSGFTSWMGETLTAPPVTGTGTPAAQASAVVGDGSVVTPSTQDAWSAADKSTDVTLSNNDKTATLSSTVANSTARSTQQLTNEAAGKYYAEFLTDVVSGAFSVGIKSTTSALTSLVETVRVRASDGQIDTVGASIVLGGLGSSIVSGDVVCVAWDAGAELIWFREGSNLWNNDAVANPATGTNGLDASALPSGAYCLFFQTTSSGNRCTVRTETAEFTQSGPSGFTSWMGEALPVTGTGALSAQAGDADGLGRSSSDGNGTPASQASAVSGVGTVSSAGVTGDGVAAAAAATVAGAGTVSTAEATGTGALAAQAADADGAGTISGAPDAWNSADKSANITLSNNDKTATLTAAVTSGVRSTTKYLNGTETRKFYLEFFLTNVISGFSNQVGLREVSAALNASAGSTFQCATNSGNILTGSATIIGNIGGAPLLDGDVVCMAWSPSTERGWFRKNGGLWNNDAAANPATNTNGFDISVLNNTDHALFFLAASSVNGGSTTIRTEAADLTYSAPSGFVSWMGEALSTPEATGTGALASQSSAVAGAGLSASTGDGATNAQAATLAGTGAVASTGVGALASDAATVSGAGVSSSIGTGNAVAGTAAVAGTGTAAAANSGALVAESAAVAGEGVSDSDGVGALAADATTIAGSGQSVSTGSGALACSPVTVAGVGVVLEEGVAVGGGELLAGAATIAGEGEVTGEVAVPPVYGGYHYRPRRKPLPVVGYGYGILPQIEGEAHGSVGAVGRSIGALPRFIGQADAAAGAAGSSSAHLAVKATALGNAVARGRGAGMIVKFEGAAVGRHDDDEAAIVAWLLAA